MQELQLVCRVVIQQNYLPAPHISYLTITDLTMHMAPCLSVQYYTLYSDKAYEEGGVWGKMFGNIMILWEGYEDLGEIYFNCV